MSKHNAWEFGKKGALWGAVAGAVVYGAAPALLFAASLITFNPVAIALAAGVTLAAAASGAIHGGVVGGLIGAGVGAVTKEKGSDLVDVQTPNGRVISVPAQSLEQAQAQEASRFQDRVDQSRGGQRLR